MARLFIMREGSTSADDCLAPRSYYELSKGPIAGKIMPEDQLQSGLKIYYRLMGWDEQGRPESSTLEKFGIDSYRSADH
jgi:aldehyde:ferredoxin oxidoreductase